jgi:tRNA-dihydrouridine synthase
MTRCAQMLEEKTHIDFIDVNLGCPIELVYQQVHKQNLCYCTQDLVMGVLKCGRAY